MSDSQLPTEARLALSKSPDYSRTFNERVNALRQKVSVAIGGTVYHNTDMNYSVSQKLVVFVDESANVRADLDESVAFQNNFFISSRGPLYTSTWLKRISGNEWIPSEVDNAPALLGLERKVQSTLNEAGLVGLYGEILGEAVENQFTEMDGSPATVFQALFTELW